ncbi:MAG: helix-turn-helix domain-containing protein [Acidimicrobiales bacterium]
MSMDTNDTSGRLSAVGLSELEERVYRELVRRGGATLAEVSDSTGASSRRAQEALAAVEAMGLLTRSAKRPTRYTPTPPQSAIEVLIRGRKEELEQVAAAARQLDDELRSNAAGVVPKQPVEVLAPGEGLAGLNRHLLASASKEILGFQTPPLAPADDEFIAFKLGILARGVSVRAVYSLDALNEPTTLGFIEAVAAAGEESRTVARLPTPLLIVDRQVAFLPLQADKRGITHEYMLVHPCSLLDSLVSLFEAVWAQAGAFDPSMPEGLASGDGPEGMPLSAQDRRLLALLAAGFNDQAIAAQLRVGSRTIERRMARLMDDLGTQTRFQTGVEATRRGWIGPINPEPRSE